MAQAHEDFILSTAGLGVEFGGFWAVKDLNLKVLRGTVHSLIGPNGAGKTTSFNLLTKFISPSEGTVRFKGRDITAMSPCDVARLGMVRSFQISAVFPSLTVFENVRVALQRKRGASFDFWRSQGVLRSLDREVEALLGSVGLTSLAHVQAGALSYGRKRALEIATTLALDPEMLLLDEPTAGMGQEDIAMTVELVRGIATNRTILMVEHNLSVVSTLSDRITVLARGRILAEGTYDVVSRDPDVLASYIGHGHA